MNEVIAAPHPFKTETKTMFLPDGMSLGQMVCHMQPDPYLRQAAHVFIGDQLILREHWNRVYPKEGEKITIRMVPMGGGGGKNPLRLILTLAVVAVAFVVSAGALGGVLGPAFAAGGIGAKLGAAAILIGGQLLINAIAPIRPPDSNVGDDKESPTFSIENARNTPRPFAPVPVVLGIHKQVPPIGVETYTETVGDDNYLRMMVVWGYGPLTISNIKIGETPIENFSNYSIETYGNYTPSPASPLTLIPDTVSQTTFSILLKSLVYNVRTTEVDTDEVSIDLAFPTGLVQFDGQGRRTNTAVQVWIQYRAVGDVGWIIPTFETTTFSSSWVQGNGSIVFNERKAENLLHGVTFRPPTRGQYEVRVFRGTLDSTNDTIYDEVYWVTLRSIKNENPLAFPKSLAVTALRIRATDQLNRVVDELSASIGSQVSDWNGSSWVANQVSNNPASLFRHVLTCAANEGAVATSRIDDETLQLWHAFCATKGFTFNQVRDFRSSVWDTLADIAAAGRASPTQIDGKWSVVYDDIQNAPVQHFTPRNSSDFSAEKVFSPMPHALRIEFSNEEQDFRQDERIVYADGYQASNATVFETLRVSGITNPSHVWKFARFHLAQLELRPERWTFNVDFEYLVARRGDLVVITHDVLLVGLASGRIKSLSTSGGSPDTITGFVSDEVLTMESGKFYGVSIRNPNDSELTAQIVTNAGDQTAVVFSTPLAIDADIAAGDLFGFGELGSETIEGLLLTIEPATELNARLTCIPYSVGVYTADGGTIPTFDSKLGALEQVPTAEITLVRSDESAIEVGAGNTLLPRIAVAVKKPTYSAGGLVLQAQYRSTGLSDPFRPVPIRSQTELEIIFGGVQEGQQYDIRVRWNDPNRLPAAWTEISAHKVVGQTNPPAALVGATLSVFGGGALIRWNSPTELDVKFGGTVRFRHSPETDPAAATWQSSTSIGQAANADALFMMLPLKPGTYLARVFDKGGRPAVTVNKLATKQSSVLTFANVDSITEHTAFTGSKTNVVLDGSTIKLSATTLIDDVADFDSIYDFDAEGGVALTGTYEFSGGLDLSTVKKVRATSAITASTINVLDRIDDRTTVIDSWEDFDGTAAAVADARVEVRGTDDDPAGSPVTWDEWARLDSGDFEHRGFQFRAILDTNDPAYNIVISQLSVSLDEVV